MKGDPLAAPLLGRGQPALDQGSRRAVAAVPEAGGVVDEEEVAGARHPGEVAERVVQGVPVVAEVLGETERFGQLCEELAVTLDLGAVDRRLDQAGKSGDAEGGRRFGGEEMDAVPGGALQVFDGHRKLSGSIFWKVW